MAFFQVLLTKKAEREFLAFPADEQDAIRTELKRLATDPFPFKKKIKKIKGVREPMYRLRVDLRTDSYRIFYGIVKPNQVIVLRIVPKKEADRVLAALR